jgi:hypothetical protein
MKKFVVAYVNFFDNELIQKVVEAKNEIQAVKKFEIEMAKNEETKKEIGELFEANYGNPTSITELRLAAADMECDWCVTEI